MFKLESIIRPHILALKPYSTARDDFKGQADIFLDANENPHGGVIHGPYSRYPDPQQKRLKAGLAKIQGVTSEEVFISHGSDEGIELLIRACAEPGKDSILVMPPTYSMYQISAQINNVAIIEVPLTASFLIDVPRVCAALTSAIKILFICSPNNPTGTAQRRDDIRHLCEKFSGIVVVDEAYIDFCPENSVLPLIHEYANLVVLQTFSKAWGLPALRVGVLYAQKDLVAVLTKIKPPYNISGVTQELALQALRQKERKSEMAKQIVQSREQLASELRDVACVRAIEPSEANFLLVRVDDPKAVYNEFLRHGIVVRDRSGQHNCQGGLRISVGTPYENARLVAVLREFSGEKLSNIQPEVGRRAIVQRRTNETAIVIDLNLDGSGETFVSTGVNFFDHMLNQLGKHSGVDLSISVQGDLDIDEHHTIEDVGIALGEAIRKALGEKRGIERYGFSAPMDEARATTTLDFSGRSFLVWNVNFTREYVGDLPTEMVKHFFHSLADSAKLTLHIDCTGENEHHKIEGIFKSFSQALRQAIRQTKGNEVPSTKGVL
jgi:histidinol-phosphate aminotransferase